MRYFVTRVRKETISAYVEADDEEQAQEKFEDMECDPNSDLLEDDHSEIYIEESPRES